MDIIELLKSLELPHDAAYIEALAIHWGYGHNTNPIDSPAGHAWLKQQLLHRVRELVY